MIQTRVVGGLLAAVCVAAGGAARADGAFPDEFQLFLPADHPSRIVVAANFGLLESDDDGATWGFICEAEAGAPGNLNLYQMGPTDTLLAEFFGGVVRSGDEGCVWDRAAGSVAADGGRSVWDGAFDPLTPGRVLVLGAWAPSGSAIFPSADDGRSFGPPVYATGAALTGIEFSSSSAGVVYATGNEVTQDGGGALGFGPPFVVAGADGGATWGVPVDHPEVAALLGTDGGVQVGLAAVDPRDPRTVYLRLTVEPTGPDYLGVTRDSGKTVQVLFRSPERMTSFLVAQDGTLYVGTRNGTGAGGIFASQPDGGFAAVEQECPDGGICDLHVRCLGERMGALYACADNWQDGFALGRSTDRGRTFTGLLRFSGISGLAACSGSDLQSTCQATWGALAQLFGIDAGSAAGEADGGAAPAPSRGCACSTGDGFALAALLAALGIARRRGK